MPQFAQLDMLRTRTGQLLVAEVAATPADSRFPSDGAYTGFEHGSDLLLHRYDGADPPALVDTVTITDGLFPVTTAGVLTQYTPPAIPWPSATTGCNGVSLKERRDGTLDVFTTLAYPIHDENFAYPAFNYASSRNDNAAVFRTLKGFTSRDGGDTWQAATVPAWTFLDRVVHGGSDPLGIRLVMAQNGLFTNVLLISASGQWADTAALLGADGVTWSYSALRSLFGTFSARGDVRLRRDGALVWSTINGNTVTLRIVRKAPASGTLTFGTAGGVTVIGKTYQEITHDQGPSLYAVMVWELNAGKWLVTAGDGGSTGVPALSTPVAVVTAGRSRGSLMRENDGSWLFAYWDGSAIAFLKCRDLKADSSGTWA